PVTLGAFQTAAAGGGDAFVTKLNPTGSGLVYSTYLGGSRFDQGRGIAVDAGGNAYVVGLTFSFDFPTTLGAFQTTNHSDQFNVFVTKLNPTGSGLVYSTYLGGGEFDYGNDIAVDSSGSAYVVGTTFSGDFPTTPGAFEGNTGTGDAFVTKFNPTGTSLVYSTRLGGSSEDLANAVAVDSSGNAYVTGSTPSTDFPTTPGAYQTSWAGGSGPLPSDAFVTKLNPTGSGLVYSTYLGGSDNDGGTAIATDVLGNAYVAGTTSSTNFPTTIGAFQTSFGGGPADAFVTKLNPTGSGLV